MGERAEREAMDWTLPENLAKLKELAERATPGPWIIFPARASILIRDEENDWPVAIVNDGDGSQRKGNADFIVAAREALPQLIAALEKKHGAS